MEETENICNRVIVINKGKIIKNGTIDLSNIALMTISTIIYMFSTCTHNKTT